MKKKLEQNDLFRKGDFVLPSVYWDMVLAEYGRPILFTCLDEYDNLYICSCYHAGGDAVEWMLVKTTEEAVIKLLQNQIPIHDMFSDAETVYLLTLSERGAQPQAVKKATQDVPENYFPTAGYDMDAEEGEFDEEIAELRERIAERESDPYRVISSVQTTLIPVFFYKWKETFPDIKAVDMISKDALESYAFSEETSFRLFFARTQADISEIPKKAREVKFPASPSISYRANIQLSAYSLLAR